MLSRVVRTDDFGGSWAVVLRDTMIPVRYRTEGEALDVLTELLRPFRVPENHQARRARLDRALVKAGARAAHYGLATA